MLSLSGSSESLTWNLPTTPFQRRFWEEDDEMTKLVLDCRSGRYVEGFEPARVYRFSRSDGENGFIGKLSDQSPFFNVAGLYYSELPASISANAT